MNQHLFVFGFSECLEMAERTSRVFKFWSCPSQSSNLRNAVTGPQVTSPTQTSEDRLVDRLMQSDKVNKVGV